MAQQVPNGTVLTYQGKWDIPFSLFNNKPEVLNQVMQRCVASGIVVRDYKQLDSTLFGSITMQLTLQVQNNLGFERVEDVSSIVNNGVYLATGKLPQSYSIPSIQRPNAPTPTSTGQPSTNTTPSGQSWWDRFTSWLNTFTTGGLLGGLVVAGGVVVAFFLIGTSPLSKATRSRRR